ncbi:MAG: hypothetical protein ACTSRU_02690 [Candidatus Hodarchaeales archaeon]
MNGDDKRIPDADPVTAGHSKKKDDDSWIQKEIELLKNSLLDLHKENQLFLGILSASSLLNLLARSDDEKRDRLITELSPFFSDFELYFQEMLLEEITNPMVFKLGETLLDELTVVFSELGFYEKVEDRAEETSSVFFSRKTSVNDRWDLIDEVDGLLSRYAHLSHLKLPNFWKEVILELHRYDYPEIDEDQLFIVTPTKIIMKIINKLLREAPCAQILQRYKRRKDSSGGSNQELDQDSITSIMHSVRKYNERLSSIIKNSNLEKEEAGSENGTFNGSEEKPSVNAKKLLKKIENYYSNFNLGTAHTEMRIPQTYQKIIRNTLDEAVDMIDNDDSLDLEVIVNLLSVQLIYDLNNDIYKLKEFLELMQDIKS